MTTSWSARAAVQIEFGDGLLDKLADLVTARRILLVTSKGFARRGIVDRLEKALGNQLVGVFDAVEPNPDADVLDAATRQLRALAPELLVALGGGSVIDTAKALAITLAAPESWSIAAHFRSGGLLPAASPLPIAAIPTTAGTGAEVTPFATVWDRERGVKYSLALPELRPQLALLDPSLTVDLPRPVTISSGLDAVSQALESLWNRASNPVSSAWALQSLRLSLPTLAALANDLQNLELRARMLEASLLAGLAISITRTSIAHSMSYPLTARFGIPHGLACSFTLPAVLEFNRQQDDGRLEAIATALGLNGTGALGNALLTLLENLGAAELISDYVAQPARMFEVADEMITPGRADTNMRAVGPADVRVILSQAIGQLWPARGQAFENPGAVGRP